METFEIDYAAGYIRIKTDPDIAKDLIFILSTLLDLSKTLRTKIHHARALNSVNEEDYKRRRKIFEKESREVFTRFNEHMNNGCNGNRTAAMQIIKKEFKLGYGEAKICIQEGRRLFRLERKA
jgi:hypothetical protein